MYKWSTTITSGYRTTITKIRCPAYERSFSVLEAGQLLHDIVKTSSRITRRYTIQKLLVVMSPMLSLFLIAWQIQEELYPQMNIDYLNKKINKISNDSC